VACFVVCRLNSARYTLTLQKVHVVGLSPPAADGSAPAWTGEAVVTIFSRGGDCGSPTEGAAYVLLGSSADGPRADAAAAAADPVLAARWPGGAPRRAGAGRGGVSSTRRPLGREESQGAKNHSFSVEEDF